MSNFVVTEARTRVDMFGEARVAQLVGRKIVSAEALPYVLAGYGFPKRAMASDYMHHKHTLVRWDPHSS